MKRGEGTERCRQSQREREADFLLSHRAGVTRLVVLCVTVQHALTHSATVPQMRLRGRLQERQLFQERIRGREALCWGREEVKDPALWSYVELESFFFISLSAFSSFLIDYLLFSVFFFLSFFLRAKAMKMTGGQQAQTIGGCLCLSFEIPWNVILNVSFNLLAHVKPVE